MYMKKIQLIMIDFNKSWWIIIFKQKCLLLGVVMAVTIRDLFAAVEPFLVATLLEKQSWYLFAAASSFWVLFMLDVIVLSFINPRFQLSVIHSLLNSAHQRLLLIDPIYHVKRSSGQMLAKIERASRGYEDILDQITFDFAPLVLGIASMLMVFAYYSWLLMGAVAICLASMIGYAYYFARYGVQHIEQNFIVSDDIFKEVAFENLAQINLIRATFATGYMRDKLTQTVSNNAQTEQVVWRSYSFVSRVLNALYIISVVILVAFFMREIKVGHTLLSQAIGIILAYINSTRSLIKIVHPMRKYMRGYIAVRDLFEAMQRFGEQTIPVFQGASIVINKKDDLSVSALNVAFTYQDAAIFNDHSLVLTVSQKQSNKLYGLIGPSGAGKTTLLSILGGQLKPHDGEILINGINIYAVDDEVRKRLIALQGQIATNVRGSVRYNLLFGLPEAHGYDDTYLMHMLDRIGLKTVLEEHQGLDTLLGEGALNISGGQRQRLNFAALYLRARYYNPILILIDEPTSSLDEISERAVTSMIVELSASAITIVIAHRLKTIEQAVGIIDLSLLSDQKEIQIYDPERLKEHSDYYEELFQGD